MVSTDVIGAIKNIALAGVGAGVTALALLHGIANAYTTTVLVSFYTYYGIHIYSSNKISTVAGAVK
jgi:hypothetical protein